MSSEGTEPQPVPARRAGGSELNAPADQLVGPFELGHFVQYAGVSGDFNPIHFDIDLVKTLGHRDIFAMGMLPGALAAEYAAAWLAPRRVLALRVRFIDKVWRGQSVTFTGAITSVDDDDRVAFEITATASDGTAKLTGTGTAGW